MIKRLLDFVIASISLVILSPILAAVALLVRINMGGPVFFSQIRPGLHGKPFRMVKFRTMLPEENGQGRKLSDSERLTKFGKALRSTSLDELPELWNIIKGDMSFVGPRPLLMQYLPLYSPEQARRHDVRPGLTGWAQVNGRNSIEWAEKFALDVWYVDNQTLVLDLQIVLRTLGKTLARSGISEDGEATMSAFKGD